MVTGRFTFDAGIPGRVTCGVSAISVLRGHCGAELSGLVLAAGDTLQCTALVCLLHAFIRAGCDRPWARRAGSTSAVRYVVIGVIVIFRERRTVRCPIVRSVAMNALDLMLLREASTPALIGRRLVADTNREDWSVCSIELQRYSFEG